MDDKIKKALLSWQNQNEVTGEIKFHVDKLAVQENEVINLSKNYTYK